MYDRFGNWYADYAGQPAPRQPAPPPAQQAYQQQPVQPADTRVRNIPLITVKTMAEVYASPVAMGESQLFVLEDESAFVAKTMEQDGPKYDTYPRAAAAPAPQQQPAPAPGFDPANYPTRGEVESWVSSFVDRYFNERMAQQPTPTPVKAARRGESAS